MQNPVQLVEIADCTETQDVKTEMNYTWQRFGGYEVSSKGDSRFSAFYARLDDGRTIEEHYQCDVKGYDIGGTNWRLGKGKPPIRDCDLWMEYLTLWKRWVEMNPLLIDELKKLVEPYNNILSDRFASTPVNQARALATILHEREENNESSS